MDATTELFGEHQKQMRDVPHACAMDTLLNTAYEIAGEIVTFYMSKKLFEGQLKKENVSEQMQKLVDQLFSDGQIERIHDKEETFRQLLVSIQGLSAMQQAVFAAAKKAQQEKSDDKGDDGNMPNLRTVPPAGDD